MNKRTRAIDDDTYKLIISTIQNGFEYDGINHKPNERIATVLQLEYNLGLRVGDILNLTMDSFVVAGTLIATTLGVVSIEQIQPGMTVYAMDEESGTIVSNQVVQTFERETKEVPKPVTTIL